MSFSLILSCLWVLASAVVAVLPMKRQYAPGVVLLCLAPVLIIWLAYVHGWWVGLVGAAGFVSMFRNPLIYIFHKLRGQHPKVPE